VLLNAHAEDSAILLVLGFLRNFEDEDEDEE
jgi:hypothetical protein